MAEAFHEKYRRLSANPGEKPRARGKWTIPASTLARILPVARAESLTAEEAARRFGYTSEEAVAAIQQALDNDGR